MSSNFNKSSLIDKRRMLRKNQTGTEGILWYHLRARRMAGKKFYRQYSVGSFILDFYCPEIRLAIEVDGSQHYSPVAKRYDTERTAFLKKFDIKVLRFTNLEILQNLYEVCRMIYETIEKM